MSEAIELLETHLNATCKSLAIWKAAKNNLYDKQINLFEKQKQSYLDAIEKIKANGDIKDHDKALPIHDVVQLLRKYNGFLSANYHNATYDNSDITEFLSEQ